MSWPAESWNESKLSPTEGLTSDRQKRSEGKGKGRRKEGVEVGCSVVLLTRHGEFEKFEGFCVRCLLYI